MKFQQGLRRIQHQLDGLERMVRMIRSEIENQTSALPGYEIAGISQIKNGLSSAFASGESVSPVTIQPYDHILPDIWVGLDQEKGAASVAFASKTISSTSPVSGNSHVTRITLNPVFPILEKPRWVTLETRVDLAETAAAKSIRLDLVSSIEIARTNREELPRTIGLTFRIVLANGGSKDFFHHKIPVTTLPMEHSILINEAALKAADIATAKNIFLILELPVNGDYLFNLDWFSVKSMAS